MIKRIVWFVSGAVAGIGGALFAGKKVRRTVTSLVPVKVINRAATSTRSRFSSLSDAWSTGKEAMHDKENELKARRDGRVETLSSHSHLDPLQPGDEVLVDGERVEPGRVIVLRQVDDPKQPRRSRLSRHRRP
jgi:microcompartment protein CcmL/EutN